MPRPPLRTSPAVLRAPCPCTAYPERGAAAIRGNARGPLAQNQVSPALSARGNQPPTDFSATRRTLRPYCFLSVW